MLKLFASVWLILITTATVAQEGLPRTEPISRAHYRTLVRMAECTTISCLVEQRKELPREDTLASLVYFSRQMRIRPSRDAAAGLLRSVPKDEAVQMTFVNFTSWQDGISESEHDMAVLGQIYEEWPKTVSKAALMRPDLMATYVEFLRLAPNDIHSDFTGNAEKVCKKERLAFNKAFLALGEEDQKYIRAYVFQPRSCTAIFRSEAE